MSTMHQNTCTFGGRSPAQPAGGAYSAPQTPRHTLAGFQGPTSKRGEGRGGKQCENCEKITGGWQIWGEALQAQNGVVVGEGWAVEWALLLHRKFF